LAVWLLTEGTCCKHGYPHYKAKYGRSYYFSLFHPHSPLLYQLQAWTCFSILFEYSENKNEKIPRKVGKFFDSIKKDPEDYSRASYISLVLR
jgi:hypothetical protein